MSAMSTVRISALIAKMMRHDPTRRRNAPSCLPLSCWVSPPWGSLFIGGSAFSIRSRSRDGILSRDRSARLLNLTSQSMKYVVEAAGFARREFLLRLVKRFELARQRFFGHRRQHDPTALGCHLELVTVMHVER